MSSDGVVVLLYLNIFLVVGVLLRHIFSHLSKLIPYTVCAASGLRDHTQRRALPPLFSHAHQAAPPAGRPQTALCILTVHRHVASPRCAHTPLCRHRAACAACAGTPHAHWHAIRLRRTRAGGAGGLTARCTAAVAGVPAPSDPRRRRRRRRLRQRRGSDQLRWLRVVVLLGLGARQRERGLGPEGRFHHGHRIDRLHGPAPPPL
eukprot:4629423-Prymnesium_polylepis.1